MSEKKKSTPTFWRFIISKVFLLNVAIAATCIFLLIWITLLFIQNYSRHGESKTVPDIKGMTVSEAKNLLDESDLRYTVVDSTYNPEERPLSILNQDPLPDTKVKNGRSIYITVNMTHPPLTDVPSIDIGTSVVSVREILVSHGLKIGDISYKPFEYRDVFLDMTLEGKILKPGDKIAKGTKIDLILGNGLGDTQLEIPDLTGFTYVEAINLLQLKDLSIGTIIPTGTITDTTNAFVYKQSPSYEAGKMVNLGTMVDLWITQDESDIIIENTNDTDH